MRPPDLDAGLCRTLSPATLEKTFFFPAATAVRYTPSRAAQAAWDAAKEICIECPVFLRCRATCWSQEYGVIGGTDEHERYLERRRLMRYLAAKTPEERAQLAEYFHTRHAGGLGDPVAAIARSTGYSEQVIKALMAEHQALLEQREEEKTARVYGKLSDEELAQVRHLAEGGASLRYIATAMGRGLKLIERTLAGIRLEDRIAPQWPRQRPPGDAWVWIDGVIRNGFYIGETVDGAYFFMQVRIGGNGTKRWFPAHFVEMRSTFTRTVLEWKGRSDEQKTA